MFYIIIIVLIIVFTYAYFDKRAKDAYKKNLEVEDKRAKEREHEREKKEREAETEELLERFSKLDTDQKKAVVDDYLNFLQEEREKEDEN